MIQIERHNAWSFIRGAPQWFLTYLARHLSVPVEDGSEAGTRFSIVWKHQGESYGSLVHGNRVAAGLTLHVAQLAQHYGLHGEIRDVRARPVEQYPWHSVRVRWRPYQDQVHRQLCLYDVGIVDAPPRSGKTVMAARVVDSLAVPTLYVAPSVAIVRQTYDVFVHFFGENAVARLDGDALPHQKDVTKPIVIATAVSAVRQPKEWFATRQLLIIDEFHHSAAETYHRLNALADQTYYRYGFTGTHFRTGDDMLAMEAICSTVLYRITPAMLIPEYLAVPDIFFARARAAPCGGADWKVAYRKGIVESEKRNELAAMIANACVRARVPTIVLTRHRAHADALGSLIHGSVVVKGGEGALTSAAVQEFLAGRVDCLVGTTVIGEGVDLPRATALVFASGGSDGVTMLQSYYRPMTALPGKDAAKIYDFIDTHHGTLARHSRNRIAMAKEHFGDSRVIEGV